MLDTSDEVLTTMAGSFGYAAPEVMLKRGHGKPVDMWSLGVITYTLLCGYSPFRSETLPDLIEECKHGRIVFHERYWKDVSKEAKNFIIRLLQPDPNKRASSEEALQDIWIVGDTATDHNILPELRTYMAKARLRRGIEIIKLANRIEQLKIKEDEAEDVPGEGDVPANAKEAAGLALDRHTQSKGLSTSEMPQKGGRLSKAARGAIFREVVLAKVREIKEKRERDEVEAQAKRTSSPLS
jgi:calcium/calmodulin-dependent protein kinase I